MFSEQQSPLRHFVYVFMFNNVCTYIGNTIFTSEMLETLPPVERLILGADGIIHRGKVTALRVGIWGSMVLLSAYSSNILGVLNFTGSAFTPVVSYFGPLYYSYAHARSRKRQASTGRRIHDCLYFAAAAVYTAWGLTDLFAA